jgi:magnesium chelatase family protein
MALGRAYSVAVRGLDGEIVEIEADITSGLPGVHLVGLADAALQESRDRVRSAITNSENQWPMARLTLALSPATLPKMGSVYDIALASAVLSASRKKRWHRLEKTVLLGELALDGRVRPIRGVLPAALAARRDGWQAVVVPMDNLAEASLVDGIEVLGVGTLSQLQAWLDGAARLAERVSAGEPVNGAEADLADLADVVGQTQARAAVEIAAAGAHHLMLTGPPGIGKTMLAQRLPGLLPPLSESEALEVTAIHSVAGTLSPDTPLITRPPFIAPHHTSSVAALVGGGAGMARPGAISRAHRGVLFLDECAEIGVSAMEALRTPLEDGEIRLARRDGVARYPARFQLVLAANPCPCAPADPRECICAPAVKRRYLGKLSGPLLDRVDLRVQMHPIRAGAFADQAGESTSMVRARVAAAREAAVARWTAVGVRTNAEVPGPVLRRGFRPNRQAMAPLRTALERGVLSIRGVDRTLRIAWSVADLAGHDSPGVDDVATALSFRQNGVAR